MKIEKCQATSVSVGDVIEKCFFNFRVLSVREIKIGSFDAREFLCVPVSRIPGVESCYFEAFSDDELTTWKASEVSP